MNESDHKFKPPKFSSPDLAMMFNPDTPYTLLQFSLIITQEYCKGTGFGGKFPLMRSAGDEAYNAWIVDPEAPPEFWLTRRQEILEGKAGDSIFVPLVPDSVNFLRHPIAVAKANRLQARTKGIYGDGFRFVFTRDPDDPEGERYVIRPYVFAPADRALPPFSSDSRPMISTP